jgi:hypothetical protein
MSSTPDTLERALRAGPTDEGGYRARPVVDPAMDDVASSASHSVGTSPRPGIRPRPSGVLATQRWGSLVATALIVAAAAAGFSLGRASNVGSAGAAGTSGSLVRPAVIADSLVHAWAQATQAVQPSDPVVMVCAADPVRSCALHAAILLSSDPSQGNLPPSTPVRDYWTRLSPAAAQAGHLVGAFMLPGGEPPAASFDVRLLALDAPPGSAGAAVESAFSPVPGYFFDLGSVGAGSYALVLAHDPVKPGSAVYALGIVVAP